MKCYGDRKSFVLKIETVIFIVFIILLSLGSQAYHTENRTDEQFGIYSKSITKLSSLSVDKYPTVAEKNFVFHDSPTFTNNSEILPKDMFPIQKQPRIITDKPILFSLIETKEFPSAPSQLTATYSEDYGKTWLERMTISHNITSFSNPSLDYTGDSDMQAYGAHLLDINTGTQLIFGFPNLTNPETDYIGSTHDFDMYGWFNGRILTWDDYWTELGDTETAGYPHGTDVGPYKNFHGFTIWAGHDGTGWSYYFFCETDETTDQPYKFLWKNYINDEIRNVDIDIDLSTGWAYDLCEIYNETTNQPEILLDMMYLEPGNAEWFNKESNYGNSFVFKNYKNPALKASNGYVYLACEKNGDIYVHRSDDKGFFYSTTQITTSQTIETNPTITGDGNFVMITYIQEGDLFVTTSIDGGITWSESSLINQDGELVSVLQNEVSSDGDSICWRNQNSTVVIDTINVEAPEITIGNVTGGTAIAAQLKNSGTVDAINIPYSININGGLLLSQRETEGVITIPAGESVSIQTDKFLLGLGKPTIDIQVGSIKVSTPSVLLFFYINI